MIRPVMSKPILKALLFIVRLLLRLIAHVEIVGLENFPQAPSYVLASNHIGRLDVVLAYYLLNRPDIIVIVAEKYQKYALTRWLTRLIDGIFIDRYHADVGALRQTLRRLQQGGILAVCPEGTRSKSGNLIEAKAGGIYLAWKASVPILPVALTGSEDAVVKARLKRFRRLNVKVLVGKPFTLPPIAGKDRQEAMRQYTDEVMCRIAALLPQEQRGFYADHPRLQELLKEGY